MQIKSGLAVYPNCSDPGILALLIEYHGDVETGILDIESDADNMACQGIPITKGWPKLFMGKKNTSKTHAAVPAPREKNLKKKTPVTFPVNKTDQKNTPSLISPSVPNLPMPGIARRPRPSPSPTWRGAVTRLRLPESGHPLFHVQNFGCKWKCLGFYKCLMQLEYSLQDISHSAHICNLGNFPKTHPTCTK